MKFITFIRSRTVRNAIFVAATAWLAGCGGSSGGSSGGQSPPPPPVDVITNYDVSLGAADVVAGSAAAGTATAEVEHNETQGILDVTVTLNGLTADSVSLRRGFPGSRGSEVFALAAGASADEWVLSGQSLPAPEAADLADGRLYLLVTTASEPEGAVRGQVLPLGIEVFRVELVPEQVAAGSASTGSGTAWFTVDENDDDVQVHVAAANLPDADGGIIGNAVAGRDGTVVEALGQDTADTTHWFVSDHALTNDLRDAAIAGMIYVQLSTPASPEGAVRGQLLPEEIELVVTDLSSDAVVMSGMSKTAADADARAMTTIGDATFTINVNLYAIGDADAVELRQAPAGQNGPVVVQFEQDLNDPALWSIIDEPLGPVLEAGLNNRALYVSVRTPTTPNGVARGQIETEASSEPADASAFLVTSTDPANASKLEGLPQQVTATLNRMPLAASVSPQAVIVEASGGDGSFGDGNETVITPSAVTSSGASVDIDLAGVNAADDVYRVTLLGGGANGIVDVNGIALDGDADGVPGGEFETAFEVETPVVVATFTKIQNEIFTPTCATAGCHTEPNPPDGLNLSAGNAYSNIVGVASVQMPALDRIEPGDPDNSYLVRKVQGTGIVASRMPLGGSPLSQEKIDLIRQWVLDGAPNN